MNQGRRTCWEALPGAGCQVVRFVPSFPSANSRNTPRSWAYILYVPLEGAEAGEAVGVGADDDVVMDER